MVPAGLIGDRDDGPSRRRALPSPRTRVRPHAELQDTTPPVQLRSRRPPVVYRPGRLAAYALLVALVSACAAAPSTESAGNPLAKVEKADGTVRVVLVPKAVERIGIETAAVRQVVLDGRRSTVVPYAALIYDTQGEPFVYTNPAALTYVRHGVRVQSVRGDLVAVTDGPPVGTVVVSVGASQLLGIELGIGS